MRAFANSEFGTAVSVLSSQRIRVSEKITTSLEAVVAVCTVDWQMVTQLSAAAWPLARPRAAQAHPEGPQPPSGRAGPNPTNLKSLQAFEEQMRQRMKYNRLQGVKDGVS